MSMTRKKISNLQTSGSTSKLNILSNNTNSNNNYRKKNLTKPGWNSSNSNLDQYKLTQEDIEKRKVLHQSKNHNFIKNDKQRQSAVTSKKQSQTNQNIDKKIQLSLLKEILFDDDQFKNILLKSDTTLKNAANLMENENLIKRTAKINFTSAPNEDLDNSVLPQDINIKQNKINVKNLNATLTDTENEDDIKTPVKHSIDDLIKCREYLIEKKNLIESQQKYKNLPLNELKHIENLDLEELENYINNQINDDIVIKIINDEKANTEKNVNKPINDTIKVNRIKSFLQNEQNINTSNNLNDLKNALQELETEIINYEEQTCRQKCAKRIIKYDKFSSYSVKLVYAVSSILHHLKQTTFELESEKEKFNECVKQLDIHRKLIDGLTTEILTVKTQNDKILNQFVTYQAKVETEIDQLRLSIRSTTNNDNFLLKNFVDNKIHPSGFHNTMKTLSNSNSNLFQQQRTLVSPSLNEPSADNDRFSERLNAMLQTDIIPGTITPLNNVNYKTKYQQTKNQLNNKNTDSRPMSAISKRSDMSDNVILTTGSKFPISHYYDFDSFLSTQQNQPISSSANNSRPSSAQQINNSNIATFRSTKKQSLNENNKQILDISLNNIETQQKFKTIQKNNEFQGHIENEIALKFPETMQHFETIENQQTLNKLKEDQHLLKEQIMLLNKQREIAQKELDKIVSNSTNSGSSINNVNHIASNNNNRSSPNLSPIPIETLCPENAAQLNEINSIQNYFKYSETDNILHLQIDN